MIFPKYISGNSSQSSIISYQMMLQKKVKVLESLLRVKVDMAVSCKNERHPYSELAPLLYWVIICKHHERSVAWPNILKDPERQQLGLSVYFSLSRRKLEWQFSWLLQSTSCTTQIFSMHIHNGWTAILIATGGLAVTTGTHHLPLLSNLNFSYLLCHFNWC